MGIEFSTPKVTDHPQNARLEERIKRNHVHKSSLENKKILHRATYRFATFGFKPFRCFQLDYLYARIEIEGAAHPLQLSSLLRRAQPSANHLDRLPGHLPQYRRRPAQLWGFVRPELQRPQRQRHFAPRHLPSPPRSRVRIGNTEQVLQPAGDQRGVAAAHEREEDERGCDDRSQVEPEAVVPVEQRARGKHADVCADTKVDQLSEGFALRAGEVGTRLGARRRRQRWIEHVGREGRRRGGVPKVNQVVEEGHVQPAAHLEDAVVGGPVELPGYRTVAVAVTGTTAAAGCSR